jgi:hypothetical protein
MSQRIKLAYDDLRKIKRMDPNSRRIFIKNCDKECIIRLCECAKNLLKGQAPLKACHLKKLSRHKHTLRKLALKSTSLKQRKRLIQKGGFLAALLPALIPALGSLLANIF